MPEYGHFHVFTYGTLMSRPARGTGAGTALLRGCRRVADAVVTGTLYDAGDYPALLLAGQDRVAGEVWRCPAERLAALDAYEGTTEGLFRRAAVRVDGLACWVYVAGPKLGARLKPETRITSGRWSGR